jgi:hypothetical protein
MVTRLKLWLLYLSELWGWGVLFGIQQVIPATILVDYVIHTLMAAVA